MPTLDFKGKQHIYAHHLTVPYRPLVPDNDRSLNPVGADDNLIIHGDNLHALKALLPRYAGRVKCIYIDPPYNIGNEGWVYNDRVNSPLMKAWLEDNSPVDNEDLERHDKWLCMMWPRLHLLKELLSDDGVIFVSIDDNEQHHLRMLMDEIFGEDAFLAEFVWKSRQNRDNRNVTGVSIDHEYIFCYGTSVRGEERKAGQYSNPDNDQEVTGLVAIWLDSQQRSRDQICTSILSIQKQGSTTVVLPGVGDMRGSHLRANFGEQSTLAGEARGKAKSQGLSQGSEK